MAERELRGAGHRSSVPRSAVLEAVGHQECVLTAHEIAEELRRGGRSVGIATVYRTLDALEGRKLVQRLDVGGGQPARYEPALPGGADHHHHHLLCTSCRRVFPFDDSELEEAIESVSARLDHVVEGHEVVLTGTCRTCR